MHHYGAHSHRYEYSQNGLAFDENQFSTSALSKRTPKSTSRYRIGLSVQNAFENRESGALNSCPVCKITSTVRRQDAFVPRAANSVRSPPTRCPRSTAHAFRRYVLCGAFAASIVRFRNRTSDDNNTAHGSPGKWK